MVRNSHEAIESSSPHLNGYLRTGFRLPVREDYGNKTHTETKIPFEANGATRGMVRPDDKLDWWNRHVKINKLVASHYGNRADDVWTDRLRDAEMVIGIDNGVLDFESDPDASSIEKRKFAPTMKSSSGDATAQMTGSWTVDDTATVRSGGSFVKGWPQYEFGMIAVRILVPGHSYIGEGSLVADGSASPSP